MVISGIILLTIAVFLYVGGTNLYNSSYENYRNAKANNQFVGIPYFGTQYIDLTPYENGMAIGNLMGGLGFIFIFIGAPLVAIGLVLKEEKEEDKKPTKWCNQCGKKIDIDSEYCPNCGKDFSKKQENIDKPEKKVSFCPECGTELGKSSKYCYECGYKVR